MFNPKKIILFFLSFSLVVLTSIPLKAAEKIFFYYPPLMLPLKVESLEAFAKDGTINPDLEFYLNLVTSEQKKEFQKALTKKIDLKPVLVSRFFNSQMGEAILMRLGQAITLEGGSNGGYSLRGSIVQASFAPEGLTLLNILKQFPTNLQFQGVLIAGLAQETERVAQATKTLVEKMVLWTIAEAENSGATPRRLPALGNAHQDNRIVDYSKLKDLRQRGEYKVEKKVWNLTDSQRNRSFYVNVYIPQGVPTAKIPVIIFSHGLSSRPEDYEEGLNHLASYGYLVAAPQHVGSDIIYLQEMFEGINRNIFDGNEFINRPLDISFVIDELTKSNSQEFQGKLDLENVGVVGHSFGGYTALAVAGATIDFNYLEEGCDHPYGAVNVALLLQCRALELPRKNYEFRDDRVKAVLAGNPVNRYIFGETGIRKINIPVILLSGSKDPAAPPIFEQAVPFTWLNIPDRYWGLIEGQAHVDFTKLDGGIQEALNATTHLSLPTQSLIASYVHAIALAFFQVHLLNNEDYRPYLHPSYAQYLSQDERFKFNLITQASADEVETLIKELKI